MSSSPPPSPQEGQPASRDCILLAMHELCLLCLGGITWAGFNEFYYLFTYEDSRDLFCIPYDIDILQEVFPVRAPSDTDEGFQKRVLTTARTCHVLHRQEPRRPSGGGRGRRGAQEMGGRDRPGLGALQLAERHERARRREPRVQVCGNEAAVLSRGQP